jgi:hypothetical protein
LEVGKDVAYVTLVYHYNDIWVDVSFGHYLEDKSLKPKYGCDGWSYNN